MRGKNEINLDYNKFPITPISETQENIDSSNGSEF